MKMRSITTFALSATLLACSGGGGGGGGAVYQIKANYVSTQTAQPYGLIKVVVQTQDAGAETFLRFSNAAGFDVVVPAIETTSTQTTAAVPPYEDPATGLIGAGTVSVQVLQRTGGNEELSNPFFNVTIADLPASGLAAGDLTLAFLGTIRNFLLSSQIALTGTSLDTPQNQAAVAAALVDVNALIGHVTAVQNDPFLTLDLGGIGLNQVFLTQADLAAADRMIGALLLQQNAVAQGVPAPVQASCPYGCVDAELLALTGAIAAGTPVQALLDAYFQGAIDCAVQNGLPLAWRFSTVGTVTSAGALTEATVQNAPASALLLTQSYYGLGALSLAAMLDANTPVGVPEMLDDARTYVDVAQPAAIAALAQAAGNLATYLTGADDLAAIAQTVPTFLQPTACVADLTGKWRGQYSFTINLPLPCPPMISSSGLLELDLTHAPPVVHVTGTGRLTGVTRLSQLNCRPIGTIIATAMAVGTTNGLVFDGDLTVFEPSAGLSAAIPFMANIGTGLGGEDSIDGTFVHPDLTGSFQLDRLDP
jgi:hypothetical protein